MIRLKYLLLALTIFFLGSCGESGPTERVIEFLSITQNEIVVYADQPFSGGGFQYKLFMDQDITKIDTL